VCAVCKTKSNLGKIKSVININSEPLNIINVIAKVVAIGIKKQGSESIIQKSVKTIAERNYPKGRQGKSESATFNNLFD